MKQGLTRSISGLTLPSGLLVCALGVGALPFQSVAITAANPYEPIIERNVFGLKPPVPVVDPNAEAAAKNPPSKVLLTGITTILGNKRALMKSNPAPKPGETAKEQYYMLTEGQQEGDIEVLSIDEKAGLVRIKNQGQVVNLDITKDAPKIAAAPVAAPAPGMPIPAPGMGALQPAGVPGGPPGFPTRTLRLPTSGNAAGLPGMPGVTPAGVGGVQPQAGGVTMPGFGMASQSPGQQQINPVHQLSVEEQMLMVEVERERTKSQVTSGRLPPLPPTRYTPPGAPGSIQQTPETQNTPSIPGFPSLPIPGQTMPPQFSQ
jgi:hypothetical protein